MLLKSVHGRLLGGFIPSVVLLLIGGSFSACEKQNADATANSLTIITKPVSGAQVRLAGTVAGVTPLTVTDPPKGDLMVSIEAEGYKSTWKAVRIPDDLGNPVVIELEPRVGYLTLDSDPPEAQVKLNGTTELGVTPLDSVPIPIGDHVLELTKQHHEPLTRTVHIEEDFRYNYTYAMKARPGQVEIYSIPTGARVWINSQLQLERTPMRLTLDSGPYSVAVHAKGYVQSEKTIELQPNGHEVIQLELVQGNAPPGMVLVPAGPFIRGAESVSPDERPQSTIEVDAFYIDKYEVTNAQFKEVFDTHDFKDGLGNHPVTGVTWEQAMAYAKAVGKRLPTEIEWEKAARGPDGLKYPWGDEFDPAKCNVKVDGPTNTSEAVGTYPLGASIYGCVDMAGNAYEWTSSWYNAYPGNTDIKQEYGQVFRVLRGGSFLSDPFDARTTRRIYDRADNARQDYGFRCVSDILDEAGSTARPAASPVPSTPVTASPVAPSQEAVSPLPTPDPGSPSVGSAVP